MNAKINKSAALILAAMLALAPAAWANHWGFGEGHGHDSKSKCMYGDKSDLENQFYWKAGSILDQASELALTEKQQNDIKDLKHEVKKSMIKQTADIETFELDIEKMMRENAIEP